jgi:glucose/arabinose dehydrogenase
MVWAAATIGVRRLATGLDLPVAVTHAGDGSGRLFITLQHGQIVIYDGQRVLPRPFLNIASRVSCCGERGLLSVAFHPRYARNGLLYVNYTNLDGHTVIARYQVSSHPNSVNPRSARVLLTIRQPYTNHNGGQLQFGPDGYLYIGMGDGGSGGDPQNRAQNLRTLLGKMLRIDVDRGRRYAIPPDNPFVNRPGARKEIWALGLRNPWRFSFDRLTGALFIGDVGQHNWEEVNVQPANSPGGENYGWRRMEGRHCFRPASNCDDGTLTLPILEYSHNDNRRCSITGGYRYRGRRIPQHYGTYFYGDYCTGLIWGARPDGRHWTATRLLDLPLNTSAFGEDEVGELYMVHRAEGAGTLYRFVSRVLGPQIIAANSLTDRNGGWLQPGDAVRYTIRLENVGRMPQPNNPGFEFWDRLNPDTLELLGAKASTGRIIAHLDTHLTRWNGEIPPGGVVDITIQARIRSGVTGVVCNQGIVRYDADRNGDNDTSVRTDNPDTILVGDRTCGRIGKPVRGERSARVGLHIHPHPQAF